MLPTPDGWCTAPSKKDDRALEKVTDACSTLAQDNAVMSNQ
jgi:hypothetical protein